MLWVTVLILAIIIATIAYHIGYFFEWHKDKAISTPSAPKDPEGSPGGTSYSSFMYTPLPAENSIKSVYDDQEKMMAQLNSTFTSVLGTENIQPGSMVSVSHQNDVALIESHAPKLGLSSPPDGDVYSGLGSILDMHYNTSTWTPTSEIKAKLAKTAKVAKTQSAGRKFRD